MTVEAAAAANARWKGLPVGTVRSKVAAPIPESSWSPSTAFLVLSLMFAVTLFGRCARRPSAASFDAELATACNRVDVGHHPLDEGRTRVGGAHRLGDGAVLDLGMARFRHRMTRRVLRTR